MARKRLLTLMLSAIFLLCFVGSALAAGPARRYVGSSTAKGAIYQSSYRVDAQSLTGVKSINITATLYEKGRIGTWQVVSRSTVKGLHSQLLISSPCSVLSGFCTQSVRLFRQAATDLPLFLCSAIKRVAASSTTSQQKENAAQWRHKNFIIQQSSH